MVCDVREALAPEISDGGNALLSSHFCERNWSAHGHIHMKICNKLGSETTEKLVYVYSKSKMAATVRDADELKMFSWVALTCALPGPARSA